MGFCVSCSVCKGCWAPRARLLIICSALNRGRALLAKTSARQSQKFGRRRGFAKRQLASEGRKQF